MVEGAIVAEILMVEHCYGKQDSRNDETNQVQARMDAEGTVAVVGGSRGAAVVVHWIPKT